MPNSTITQCIDGISYKLKKHFDFSFLHKYGQVFKVFDKQESGNICFGISGAEKRYFVKFAGAPTEKYFSDIPSAVSRLKDAEQVYKDLSHPNLVNLLGSEEIGDGFALIFEWTNAEVMHTDYGIENERFKQTTTEMRMRIFDDILDFHKCAVEKGYIATDFYEANIMWDFDKKETVICDIDFYSKTPWGGMTFWGNSPLSAPEERIDGGIRDEITNVYNMGAIAFVLFSGGSRSIESWPLDARLYAVALKAISDERNERQQTIKDLVFEWEAMK